MTFGEQRDHGDFPAFEMIDEFLRIEIMYRVDGKLGHMKVHMNLTHVAKELVLFVYHGITFLL
jgi:hypothetical protein